VDGRGRMEGVDGGTVSLRPSAFRSLEFLEPRLLLSADSLGNAISIPQENPLEQSPVDVSLRQSEARVFESDPSPILAYLASADPGIDECPAAAREPGDHFDEPPDEPSVTAVSQSVELSVGVTASPMMLRLGQAKTAVQVGVKRADESALLPNEPKHPIVADQANPIGGSETPSIEIRGPPSDESTSISTCVNLDYGIEVESSKSADMEGVPRETEWMAPDLPGLYLVDPDPANLAGQIIYLDFDGAENVTYKGPVTVGPFDIPAFQGRGELAGQEQAIVTEVLSQLERLFAGSGVTFTTEPTCSQVYSSVYVGGNGTPFSRYGSFLGLAEQVDVLNQDPADNCFIFSDKIPCNYGGAAEFARELAWIVAHEVGHLVGYGHRDSKRDIGRLGHVAQGEVPILTGRQPNGHLDGKIVFVNAGHGVTAYGDASDSWRLQRPAENGMVEDFGNQDQLSLLVDYLFNAGATVVPLRPVGHQPNEVLLDNDDGELFNRAHADAELDDSALEYMPVRFFGDWDEGRELSYYSRDVSAMVPYHYTIANALETAIARYRPRIEESGFYPVYAWAAADATRVNNQLYRIRHAGGETEVTVNHRAVGNGWIYLGTYYLEQGSSSYVDISNRCEGAQGSVVVADAIRFGNGYGPSGAPREDEASLYWIAAQVPHGMDIGLFTERRPHESDDSGANIRAIPRWAAHMNRHEEGTVTDRLLISLHSNAGSENARGAFTIYNYLEASRTPNQVVLAETIGESVDNHLTARSGEFEHPWQTYAGGVFLDSQALNGWDFYGEINNQSIVASNPDHVDEFDATILEVAFHTNAEDADLLRGPKFRDAVAYATYQGIVEYFEGMDSSALQCSPGAVDNLRATTDDGGTVHLAWDAPSSGPDSGGPAEGYNVYVATDGYGFGLLAANVESTSYAIRNLDPACAVYYFRVTAVNPGGESLPSPVVAAWPVAGAGRRILIVDDFRRLDRLQNGFQELPDLGVGVERVRPRGSNSFDYCIPVAEAIRAAVQSQSLVSTSVDTAQSQAVTERSVELENYNIVIWTLCEEAAEDDNGETDTLSSTEMEMLTDYVDQGGHLFVSGTDLGVDLLQSENAHGGLFYSRILGADADRFLEGPEGPDVEYSYSNANTGMFSGIGGSIFDGVLNSEGEAVLHFRNPDERADHHGTADYVFPANGREARNALAYRYYVDATGQTKSVDGAAIECKGIGNQGNTVVLGFPFERIAEASVRGDMMARVLQFFGVQEKGFLDRCLEAIVEGWKGFAEWLSSVFSTSDASEEALSLLGGEQILGESEILGSPGDDFLDLAIRLPGLGLSLGQALGVDGGYVGVGAALNQRIVQFLEQYEQELSVDGIVNFLAGLKGVEHVDGGFEPGNRLEYELQFLEQGSPRQCPLWLGHEAEELGLSLSSSATVDYTTQISLDLVFGVDLSKLSQGDVSASFYVNVRALDISLNCETVNALDGEGQFGFLGILIENGTVVVNAEAAVQIGLADATEMTLADLLAAPLEEVVRVSRTGPTMVNLDLPVRAELGSQTILADASVAISDENLFDDIAPSFATTGFEDVQAFRNLDARDWLSMLEELSDAIGLVSGVPSLEQTVPFTVDETFASLVDLGGALQGILVAPFASDTGEMAFGTIQEYVRSLSQFSGLAENLINPTFDHDVNSLSCDFVFSGWPHRNSTIPIGELSDMGIVGSFVTASRMSLSSEASIQMGVRLDLSPLGGDAVITDETVLTELHGGRGIPEISNDVPLSLEIWTQNGSGPYAVYEDSVVTLGDVLEAINTSCGGSVVVSIDADTGALVLTDNTTGDETFRVTVADGSDSLAAAALMILGVDLDGDGILMGGPLHGDSWARQLCVEDVSLTGRFSLEGKDLDADARIGFIDAQVGNADVEISGSFSVGLASADPVSVMALLEGLIKDPSAMVTPPVLAGSGHIMMTNLSIPDGILPDLAGDAWLRVEMRDLLNTSDAELICGGSGASSFADLQNITGEEIIDAIRGAFDVRNDILGLAALDQLLPFLNRTIAELMNLDDYLDGALTDLTQTKPASWQQLNRILNEVLELRGSSLASLSLNASNHTFDIRIRLHELFNDRVALDLDLGALAGGTEQLADLGSIQAGGLIDILTEIDLALDLGITLGDGGGSPLLYDSTSLELRFLVEMEDVDFSANLLGQGLFVQDGQCALNNGDGIGAVIAVTLQEAPDGDGCYDLDTDLIQWMTPTYTGRGEITLPVYFPSTSTADRLTPDLCIVVGDIGDPGATASVLSCPDLKGTISGVGFLQNVSIASIADGLDQFIERAEGLIREKVLHKRLPLVGTALSNNAIDVFADLRNGVQNLRTEMMAGYLTAEEVRVRLANAFGREVSTVVENDDEVKYATQLEGQVNVDVPIEFDLGLPALKLEVTGGVEIVLDYSLQLYLGLDTQGFYLDTTQPDELQLDLTIQLPSGEMADCTLGFLEATVTQPQDDPSSFEARIYIDIRDVDSNGRLTLAELLGNASLSGIIVGRIESTEGATVRLDILTGADNPELPRIRARMSVDWFFSGQDLEDQIGNMPTVVFSDVALNVGDFLIDYVGPILKKIRDLIEPIKPIIDVLSYRIPVISDVAGRPLTLLDLADLYSPGTKRQAQPFVDAIAALYKLSSVGSGDPWLQLGDFSLGGGVDLRDPESPIPVPSIDITGNLDQTAANDFYRSYAGYGSDLEGFRFPIIESTSEVFKLLLGQPASFFAYRTPKLTAGFEYSYYYPFPPLPIIGLRFTGGVNVEAQFEVGYDSFGIQQFARTGYTDDILNGFYVTDLPGPEMQLGGRITVTGEVNLNPFDYFNIPAGVTELVFRAGAGGGLYASVRADFARFDDNDGDDSRIRVARILEDAVGAFDLSGALEVGLEAYVILQYKVNLLVEQITYTLVNKRWDLWRETILDFNFARDHERKPILATEVNESGDPESGTEIWELNMGPKAFRRMHGPLDGNADEEFLVVQMSDGVYVRALGYELKIADDPARVTEIVADGGGGNDAITVTGNDVAFDVTFKGGDDNDELRYRGTGRACLEGGSGNDIIRGGAGDDEILGDAGDDHIDGGDGTDTIDGGDGNDTIEGGPGGIVGAPQILIGGDGADHIEGGKGVDHIHGGPLGDTIYGRDGNDVLNGDSGNDILYGGHPADRAHVVTGIDKIYGGTGNDRIYGGNGGTLDNPQILDGGDNDDIIHGGPDVDEIYGGSGNDQIMSYGGADVIHGGPGYDLIPDDDLIDAGDGDDEIYAAGKGSAEDVIHPGSYDAESNTIYAGTGDDTVYGSAGSDRIIGGDDNDTIVGGLGNDFLYGNGGEDVIWGDCLSESPEDGNDVIAGGSLSDLIYGGGGDDEINGDSGDDIVHGGGGNDEIDGGSEDDILHGDDDNDHVIGGPGDDEIYGEDGDDVLCAALGVGLWGITADRADIEGGLGCDVIWGSAGKDYLDGGAEDDSIYGGPGEDDIEGGGGNDLLYGCERRDSADASRDTLKGGAGNDWIYGAAGGDTIEGGIGDDVLVGGDGNDHISGGEDDDDLFGGGGNDLLFGGPQNDRLKGDQDSDELYGGSGRDELILDADPADADDMMEGQGYESYMASVSTDPEIHRFIDDDLATDALVIAGTPHDDLITIGRDHEDETTVLVTFVVGGNAQEYRVRWLDGLRPQFEQFQINTGDGNNIVVFLQGPDDALDLSDLIEESRTTHDMVSIIRGGPKSDLLVGTRGPDLLIGGGQNDFLFGLDGDDRLWGDDPDNLILQIRGDDYLYAGGGNDDVLGDDLQYDGRLYGNDVLFAGPRTVEQQIIDYVYSAAGTGNPFERLRQLLDSSSGLDLIGENVAGESGYNRLYGDAGNDRLYAGHGIDFMYAGQAGDVDEFSQPFDDRLYDSENGELTLEGEAWLAYAQGLDRVWYFEGSEEADEITVHHGTIAQHEDFGTIHYLDYRQGSQPDETIYLRVEEASPDQTQWFTMSVAEYEQESDPFLTLNDDSFDVIVINARGDDDIIQVDNNVAKTVWSAGGAGNDRIRHQDLADTSSLYLRNACRDVLLGGEGDDQLLGSAGSDWIFGGPGDDVVCGGLDSQDGDLLIGDSGDDIFQLIPGEGELVAGIDELTGGPDTDMVLYAGCYQDGTGDEVSDYMTLRYKNEDIYELATLVPLQGTTQYLADSSGSFARRYARFKTGDPIEHFVIDTRGGSDVVHADEGFQFRYTDGTADPSDGSFGISASDLVQMKTPAHLVIWGGEGDDFLLGGTGNDGIRGEAGNDYIEGGPGDDVVEGGAGNDFILGDTRSGLSSSRKITVGLLVSSPAFQSGETVRDTCGVEGTVTHWDEQTSVLTIKLSSLEDFRDSDDNTYDYDLEGVESGAQATIETVAIDFTGVQPPIVPLPASATEGDPVAYDLVDPADWRIAMIQASLHENRLPGVDLQGGSPACLDDAYALTYTAVADFVVSTTDDVDDGNYGDGALSLREALHLARLATGPSTIGFADSLAESVITLASDLGTLILDDEVTIRGMPGHPITIDGNSSSGIFYVSNGATVTLSDVVVTKSWGSAILNLGSLTVDRIAVVDNMSPDYGGGIYNAAGATLSMTDSIVSGNIAAYEGGGIWHDYGLLQIEDSTISHNAAEMGGGINDWGQMTLVNCTISGNEAYGSGGGLCINAQYQQSISIINCTITDNVADSHESDWGEGGGICIDTSPNVILSNTIVAGNRVLGTSTGWDVCGVFSATSSHNLIGIIDGSANLDGVGTLHGTIGAPLEAGLGPLADNGGPTPTHALLPVSLAWDAGDNALAVDARGHPLTTDQRGCSRFYDFYGALMALVDIGAYELGALPVFDGADLPQWQSIGDFNGDGYEDFLVRGLGEDDSFYVLLGPITLDGRVPLEQRAQIVVDPGLGRPAAFRGDLGGPDGVAPDGFDDLVFVRVTDVGEWDEIEATIVWGGETTELSAHLTESGPHDTITAISPFGSGTDEVSAFALDWNGDGVKDILFSGAGVLDGSTVAALYTLTKIDDRFELHRQVTFIRGSAGSTTPTSIAVASPGDVNGDGKDDLVLGDPSYGEYHSYANLGCVYVFAGRSYDAGGEESTYELDDADQMIWGGGDRGGALAGADVVSVGDVNGDGLADFGFLAPGYERLGSGRWGLAAIVYGSRDLSVSGGLAEEADIVLWGSSDHGIPQGLTAGDFDGDGSTDLCVVWPTLTDGGTLGVYYDVAPRVADAGHNTLTLEDADLQIAGEAGAGPLGLSAQTGQLDLNNDHIHDIVVGARNAIDRRFYVLYGRRADWSYSREELQEIRGHIQENLANDRTGYLVATGASTVFPLPALDGTQGSYEVNPAYPELWFSFTTRGEGGGITAGADDDRDTNLIRLLDSHGVSIAEGYARTVYPACIPGTLYEITPEWYEDRYGDGVTIQGRDHDYLEYGILEYDLSTFFARNGEVITSAILTVHVEDASSAVADGSILVRLLELPVADGDGIAIEADMRLTTHDGTVGGTVIGELPLPVGISAGTYSIDVTEAVRQVLEDGITRCTLRLEPSDPSVKVTIASDAVRAGLAIHAVHQGVVADIYNEHGRIVALGKAAIDMRSFESGKYYMRVYNPVEPEYRETVQFRVETSAPAEGAHHPQMNRDVLYGGEGVDTLCGGRGIDVLIGVGSDVEGDAKSSRFIPVGDLEGGGYLSKAYGVSADGSVVVGTSASANGNEAFRFRLGQGQLDGLCDAGEFDGSEATAVSRDGSIIVGNRTAEVLNRAVYWTTPYEPIALDGLPSDSTLAYAVSADGQMIAGRWWDWLDDGGFVWTTDGVQILDGPVRGVSSGGTVVVGQAEGIGAFRWTESDGYLALSDDFYSGATAVSADGSTIVGWSMQTAFHWTEAGGLQLLGEDWPGEALAVSGDGSVVVGWADFGEGYEAFIWDAAGGIRSLRQTLIADYGLAELAGWTLTKATGTSANGCTIVGFGINPDGNAEAWAVELGDVFLGASVEVHGEGIVVDSVDSSLLTKEPEPLDPVVLNRH